MSKRSKVQGIVAELQGTSRPHSPDSFYRAALQRLSEARILLKSAHYLGSIYLGGYAAECTLKSLILTRTPRSKRIAVHEEISSGVKSHNLDFLRGILLRRGSSIPLDINTAIDSVKRSWVTDLRYEASRIPHAEAAQFLEPVDLILQWVKRS